MHAKLLPLCLTLCYPVSCSLPCSSVQGILQVRKMESVAKSSSRGIFLTQGSNLQLWPFLRWQVDSLPLHHQRVMESRRMYKTAFPVWVVSSESIESGSSPLQLGNPWDRLSPRSLELGHRAPPSWLSPFSNPCPKYCPFRFSQLITLAPRSWLATLNSNFPWHLFHCTSNYYRLINGAQW